jgi:hypothetical protein
MAIACLRLFTLPALPPLPDRSVPFFLRRIALATVLLADLLYLRPPDLFRELDFFLAGMLFSRCLEERIALKVVRRLSAGRRSNQT